VIIHAVDFAVPSRFKDSDSFLGRLQAVTKRTIKHISTINNVKRVFCDLKPTLVHFQTVSSFPYLSYAKTIKAVIILHAHVYSIVRPKILLYMLRIIFRRYVDFLITPTRSIKDLFTEYVNTQVIGNPILDMSSKLESESKDIERDLRMFGYKSLNCVNFVFAGRICKVKQIHFFIQAIGLLEASLRKKIRFWIIGKPYANLDIAYQSSLKDMVDRLDIKHEVIFLGYKENIDKYLNKMDVGVLLSESEAIPMAGIEYMNHSLPVVVFNNPGLCELVKNNDPGFLIENGDVSRLADVIKFCINNPNLIKKMGKNAKKQAKDEYDTKTYVRKLLDLYDSATFV